MVVVHLQAKGGQRKSIFGAGRTLEWHAGASLERTGGGAGSRGGHQQGRDTEGRTGSRRREDRAAAQRLLNGADGDGCEHERHAGAEAKRLQHAE